ncbi:hypothetical protein [Leucobacter sp. NPDC077196]|uniref:hypothetical protein n=1 Tax=Leucobacter sp. NPDC077196 TaxID=3154959 RepID=UPI0034255AB9
MLTKRGQQWPAATAQDTESRRIRAKVATARAQTDQLKESAPVKTPRKPRSKPPAPALAARDLLAAEELIQRVLETEDQKLLSADVDLGPFKLQRILAQALKASNRPHGKKLVASTIGGWSSKEYEIHFAPHFRDFVEVQSVPVPERVGKYHPAVKAFMADKRWQYVTKEHVPRAARILQAIASEATRRGIEVMLPDDRKPNRYGYLSNPTHGNLWLRTDYDLYGIEIKEISGKGAKKFSDLGMTWQQRQKLPSWIERRGWEFISTGKLQINQGTSLDGYGTQKLSDGRGTLLEEKLSEVFARFDTWLLEQAERKRLEEIAEERRQRNWEAAMENAKADYFEAERWKYFVALSEEDEKLRKYEAFLAKAKQAIEHLPSKQRFAASGFLSEVDAVLRERNPLTSPEHFLPEISEPKPEDLKPYLRGWSPHGSHRH